MIGFFIYRKLLNFRVKPNYKGALAKGTALPAAVGCFLTALELLFKSGGKENLAKKIQKALEI